MQTAASTAVAVLEVVGPDVVPLGLLELVCVVVALVFGLDVTVAEALDVVAAVPLDALVGGFEVLLQPARSISAAPSASNCALNRLICDMEGAPFSG